MTTLPINADVVCTDGACGKSTAVVLNPVSRLVTHIAIKDKKLPDGGTRLVPVSKVASATAKQITLNCAIEDVTKMAPFIVDDLIQETPEDGAEVEGGVYTSQYVINNTGYDDIQQESIPNDEMALHSGMEVEASDGKIGKLDALVLDPKSGAVTDLLMRKGHLWGAKDITIPMANVDVVDGKTVYLKIDKAAVKALPATKA
jgi:sporulation protein YlmC with PRC-barrel domain